MEKSSVLPVLLIINRRLALVKEKAKRAELSMEATSNTQKREAEQENKAQGYGERGQWWMPGGPGREHGWGPPVESPWSILCVSSLFLSLTLSLLARFLF